VKYPDVLIQAACLREVLLRCGFVSDDISIFNKDKGQIVLEVFRVDIRKKWVVGSDISYWKYWSKLLTEWDLKKEPWLSEWDQSRWHQESMKVVMELIDAGFELSKGIGI